MKGKIKRVLALAVATGLSAASVVTYTSSSDGSTSDAPVTPCFTCGGHGDPKDDPKREREN